MYQYWWTRIDSVQDDGEVSVLPMQFIGYSARSLREAYKRNGGAVRFSSFGFAGIGEVGTSVLSAYRLGEPPSADTLVYLAYFTSGGKSRFDSADHYCDSCGNDALPLPGMVVAQMARRYGYGVSQVERSLCTTPSHRECRDCGRNLLGRLTDCSSCDPGTCTNCCSHCYCDHCDSWLDGDYFCGDCDRCRDDCECEPESYDDDDSPAQVEPPFRQREMGGHAMLPPHPVTEQYQRGSNAWSRRRVELIRSLRWQHEQAKKFFHATPGSHLFTDRETVKSARFDFPRPIGVELEVSGADWAAAETAQQYPMLFRSSIVRDGSLSRGPSPAELVSPPMQGIFARRFFDEVKDLHVQSDDWQQCGLHVHVDASDLSPVEALQVVKAWAIMQPAFFGLVAAQRRYKVSDGTVTSNHYARECGRLYSAAATHWRGVKPRQQMLAISAMSGRARMSEADVARTAQLPLNRLLVSRYVSTCRGERQVLVPARAEITSKYHEARYNALNVYSWLRNGTFEFRLHEGYEPDNHDYAYYFASLCSRFVDWAATRVNHQQLDDMLTAFDPVAAPTIKGAYADRLDEIVRGNKAHLDYFDRAGA